MNLAADNLLRKRVHLVFRSLVQPLQRAGAKTAGVVNGQPQARGIDLQFNFKRYAFDSRVVC